MQQVKYFAKLHNEKEKKISVTNKCIKYKQKQEK